MIDINRDIKNVIFSGDFDEPVTLTKVDNTVTPSMSTDYPLRGIFNYSGDPINVLNVGMTDSQKLTVTISTASLLTAGAYIVDGDILTIRGKQYAAQAANDNLHGLMIVDLSE